MKHPFARTAAIAAALGALALAGCGGDDEPSTATATQTVTQATATQTQTQTQSSGTTTGSTTGQREAIVPGKDADLKTGDVSVNLKVEKVVDPVLAEVDRAQPGNKLVGVFVTGQSKGVYEATRTSVLTALTTTDGKNYGVRIISDGDCGGGFSTDQFLTAEKKKVTGCVGFEIPKRATPKAITIAIASPKGTEESTWELPKAE